MKLPENLTRTAGLLNILVADADPTLGALVHDSCKMVTAKLRVAINADATILEMKRDSADVLFVNLQMEDNGGLELVRYVKGRWPRTQVIAVSKSRRGDSSAEAFKAGASDVLVAPVSTLKVQRSLSAIAARQNDMARLEKRNLRLRIACRRLNKARHEISQQVDLLCNDLVRAYQDMAQQLNLTQVAADYAGAVRCETGIEGLLRRRTMEWILQKLGPVNAAVYLPAGEEHFALGRLSESRYPGRCRPHRNPCQDHRPAGPRGVPSSWMMTASWANSSAQRMHPLLTGRAGWPPVARPPRQCLAVLVVFRRAEVKTPAPKPAPAASWTPSPPCWPIASRRPSACNTAYAPSPGGDVTRQRGRRGLIPALPSARR